MKMYFFNPNYYGSGYVVMAESKNKAYEYLIKYLTDMSNSDDQYAYQYKDKLELWQKVNPLEPSTFPEKYTLDEYDVGNVLHTSSD